MRNGGILGVSNTDGRGIWSPLELGLGLNSGGGTSLATRNILNGVLNCKWDKTSASPSLLEIYNTSFVKLNIDADNPLTMAFANGWDDKDRPAQVVKTLATAPANIDLSDKANCHVQIVAKIINDELVITTHDIYDPGWETWTNVIQSFASGYTDVAPFSVTNGWLSTINGWSIWADKVSSSNYPRLACDANGGTYWMAASSGSASLYVEAPFVTQINRYAFSGQTGSVKLYGYDVETSSWLALQDSTTATTLNVTATTTLINDNSKKTFAKFRVDISASTNPMIKALNLYECPFAVFSRSLNQVKDREDNVVNWVNLGYATLDASGNITALNHYTDLRNNYPGGMRVEA